MSDYALPSAALADARLTRAGSKIAVGLVLLLLVGMGIAALTGGAPDDPRYWRSFLVGFVAAVVASIPAVILLSYLDRRDPEPWWSAAISYIWGAVVATGFGIVIRALLTQTTFRRFDETAGVFETTEFGIQIVSTTALFDWLESALAAPVVEEGLKALALLLLVGLFPSLINGVRDGLIYGAMVGLGFAVVETALYIGYWYVDAGLAPYLSELVPRFVFFGLNGHALYTALFGAALGLAIESKRGWVARILMIVGGLILAISAHSASNAFGPLVIVALISLLGIDPGVVSAWELWVFTATELLMTTAWAYVILGYLVVRSGHRELQIIQTELHDEVPRAVTELEYALIESEGLWRMRRIPDIARRQSIALVRTQNRLAFRRNRLKATGRTISGDSFIDGLRQAIGDMRAASNHPDDHTP